MTSAHAKDRPGDAGLTLIEMLIVLVIIGVASSAVVLGINAIGRDRRTEDEAMRLAARLTMAVDEGLVSRARLALIWRKGGYSVQRLGPEGWTEAATPSLTRPHDLPDPLQLRRLDGLAEPVDVAPDGLGPAVDLEISGPGGIWIVAFDGFSAKARPGAAP